MGGSDHESGQPAVSQDKATNGVCIARSAFQTVPQVDRTEFVFVASSDAIVAHGHDGDLIG